MISAITRFSIFIFLILSLTAFMSAEVKDSGSSIKIINGNRNLIDIRDILESNNRRLTESDVKRICAEITSRYHQKGYTAFYIRRAALGKDGTAELFFNESIVTDIIVTGFSQKSGDLEASIFTKGEPFNEFLLKENVSGAKKRFNISRLNVTVKRGEGDQVVLLADVHENINEFEAGISSSPVFGILPELSYRFNYGGFIAGVSVTSSFRQNERSFSRGAMFFNSENNSGESYFTISADVIERYDSFDKNGELFYSQKSFSSKCGYQYQNGAAGIGFFLSGTDDILKSYPGSDGGISFAGIGLKLNYNNTRFKIDYDDITFGELIYSPGWNCIEKRLSSRLSMSYKINIPLYPGFFCSFNGNGFYLSDRERFTHLYVYDQFLPCRKDDFSTASRGSVTGVDFVFEAVRRTMFIQSGIRWGLHNGDNRNNNILAAGAKAAFNTGKAKIEMSYFYDTKQAFRDGFLMYSAAVVY